MKAIPAILIFLASGTSLVFAKTLPQYAVEVRVLWIPGVPEKLEAGEPEAADEDVVVATDKGKFSLLGGKLEVTGKTGFLWTPTLMVTSELPAEVVTDSGEKCQEDLESGDFWRQRLKTHCSVTAKPGPQNGTVRCALKGAVESSGVDPKLKIPTTSSKGFQTDVVLSKNRPVVVSLLQDDRGAFIVVLTIRDPDSIKPMTPEEIQEKLKKIKEEKGK